MHKQNIPANLVISQALKYECKIFQITPFYMKLNNKYVKLDNKNMKLDRNRNRENRKIRISDQKLYFI